MQLGWQLIAAALYYFNILSFFPSLFSDLHILSLSWCFMCYLLTMDTKLVPCVGVFFLSLCVQDLACYHCCIFYTREQLLAAQSMTVLTSARPDFPCKLRGRRWGRCVAYQEEITSTCPSIHVGRNISSVSYKVEELCWLSTGGNTSWQLMELTPDTKSFKYYRLHLSCYSVWHTNIDLFAVNGFDPMRWSPLQSQVCFKSASWRPKDWNYTVWFSELLYHFCP